jgi:hypothetical protein
LKSLKYRRTDCRYADKAIRRDVVFLAGWSSRLVHDIIQLLCALNETYCPGDGNHLQMMAGFKIIPLMLRSALRRSCICNR